MIFYSIKGNYQSLVYSCVKYNVELMKHSLDYNIQHPLLSLERVYHDNIDITVKILIAIKSQGTSATVTSYFNQPINANVGCFLNLRIHVFTFKLMIMPLRNIHIVVTVTISILFLVLSIH
jgi:hypothetical protein